MAQTLTVGLMTNPQGAHVDAYLSALAAIPEVDSVVLGDSSDSIVKLARKTLKDKLKSTYKDAASLLRESRPQMALVSLEAVLAPPIIDAALEAGCHVFAEKPSCVRAADFARLVDKAQT